jgi:hypothetical protein
VIYGTALAVELIDVHNVCIGDKLSIRRDRYLKPQLGYRGVCPVTIRG